MNFCIRKTDPFFLILLLGFLVRVYAFGSVPSGINQDELSTGYDAWSVLHYGIDRNGFLFPMMFKSWGSGMYALSGYLAWPFMLVGGLNAITIRLPHLVLGIASLVALYKLTLQCVNRRTALIAMFLLAINPWHIMISRWGLDSNIFPSLFLFTTAVFVISLKKHKYMPYSAALFALCTYTYGTAYVVVPVFLLLAGIALWKHWHIPKKIIGMSAAVFTVISMPVVLFILINQFNWSSIELPFISIPAMTTARFQTVSTVFGGNLHDIFKNLGVLWELLITQYDELPWNQIVPYGTMYPFGFFLSFYGVIAATFTVWKKRGAHPIVYMLIWLFAAVVLSTMQPVNINRINIIYIPLVFFMAYGIQNITQRNKLALTSIITVCLFYFGSFTHTYFTQYPEVIGEKFYEGLGKSISIASKSTSDAVCVTDKANMPYISALFYELIDPHVFVDTVVYTNPGDQFQHVSSFGRYTFGLSRCTDRKYGAYVLKNSESHLFSSKKYRITSFRYYSVAVPRSS